MGQKRILSNSWIQKLSGATIALMTLHVFFNVITIQPPEKHSEDPATKEQAPVTPFSCEEPNAPQVALEVFSALGFFPHKNPFAAKQAPQNCPEPPKPPLT